MVAIWLGWREGLGQAAAGGGLHLCVLTVRAQASVRHYRICTAANGLYLQEGRLFPSLEELLAYYKANWKLIHNPLLQPCVPQVGGPVPPPPPAQHTWGGAEGGASQAAGPGRSPSAAAGV